MKVELGNQKWTYANPYPNCRATDYLETLTTDLDDIAYELKQFLEESFGLSREIEPPYGDGETYVMLWVNDRSWIQIILADEYLGRGDSSQYAMIGYDVANDFGKEDRDELQKQIEEYFRKIF